jgi:peptide/nickel transport system ATP-binding protein/oligopeptide transport system ATP-binding protein
MPNSNVSAPDDLLLRVENLKVYFPIQAGLLRRTVDYVRAVDDVSFTISKGQTVGLVGESGSGKSTIGKAIIRLNPITAGHLFYAGTEITTLPEAAFRPFRKKIQMIFQDPYNSLNPRLTVAAIIGEAFEIHFSEYGKAERRDRVAGLLHKVGLKKEHLDRYPHEFSGGQRQRIGIARALAVSPDLIICDEPVSALDVSVQAQIVNLLQDLQEELGLSYLFIGHDLAVVEHMSDHVLVMNQGKLVESASAEDIYAHPKEDYTRRLLAAVPKL